MKRLLLATVAVVAAGLLSTGDAQARTWRVPGDFFALPNAISAAASGDTVQVAGNGGSTYPARDVNLDKDLTIEGGWRIDFAVRAPELYASVVRDTTSAPFDRPVFRVVGSPTIVLDGIHIVGGKYGILAVGGADLTLRDCDIHGQLHTQSESEFEPQIGTGLRMVGGTLRFEDSKIRSIRSGYPGAAMGLINVTSAELVDCVIDDVLSSPLSIDASGGAIYARDVSNLTMSGVTFDNCRTVHRGGAAYLLRTTLDATDCRFANGLGSAAGGAIYLDHCPSADFQDCSFENNRATISGAVHSLETTSLSFSGSHFTGNHCFVEAGVMQLERTDFSMIGCVFEGNFLDGNPPRVSERGGAVFAIESNGIVLGTSFTDERAEGKGGAWSQVGGVVSFTGCEFHDCDAGVFGGAIQIEQSGSVDITHSLFAGCGARFGGGVSASFTADIRLRKCTLVGGEGRSAGAAIYVDTGSTVELLDSIACCATRGDQAYCEVGTILVDHSNVWNDDTTNPRGEYGGRCPDPTGVSGNLREDPQLCPGDPEYRVALGSPCQGAASDLGDMGWQLAGCPNPSPTRVEPFSWGRVKSFYRGR